MEDAKVFFRVNNGNIIQFGAEKVAEVRTSPRPKIDRVAALAAVVQALGFRVDEIWEILDPGTLKFVPALTAGERPAEKYQGAPGHDYRHPLVWEVTFRRADLLLGDARSPSPLGRPRPPPHPGGDDHHRPLLRLRPPGAARPPFWLTLAAAALVWIVERLRKRTPGFTFLPIDPSPRALRLLGGLPQSSSSWS